MKKKNVRATIVALFSVLSFFAQESNVFHDRAFWRSNPSIATIDKYISNGYDITSLNSNAFDAVTYALIEKTDNETVKYLLSIKGNGVNKLTHDGRTYIFWAAYKNNLEMIQYLIDRGAKTDIIDTHGNTVLNFAASTGQTSEELYKCLFKYGSDITKEKNHDGANALLLVAPFLDNFKLVNYFTSNGVSLNSTDNDGNGIFDYASRGGNISFLKQLKSKRLLHDSSKENGRPVVMASKGTRGKRNGLEFYTFLEKLGVSMTGSDANHRTALHNIAYRDKDLKLINFFLQRGADVNLQDNDGNTPFLNASSRNSLEVVETLLEYVKDLNLKNKHGQTALMRAVHRNTSDVVNLLLKKGSDINVVDKNGNSLAYYIMSTFNSDDTSNFESKLAVLTSSGLNLNSTQANGNSLFHIAVEKNDLDLVKWVYALGISVNQKNNDGLMPLHLAAMKAKDHIILEFLLKIGADKTIKTDFDETVYDLAMENELLKKYNIDISFLK